MDTRPAYFLAQQSADVVMAYFTIICMCEKRGANCCALKAFLQRLNQQTDLHTVANIQPAILVPKAQAASTAPTLSAGELGCYLSHVQALEAFLKSGQAVGGTMEDDLHFTDMLSAEALVLQCSGLLQRSVAHLINLDSDWQGHSLHQKQGFMFSRFPGPNASFIMYSQKGAAAWYKALQTNALKHRYLLPVDNLYREAGVTYAVPLQTPFYQKRESEGPFASTIASDRLNHYKHWWKACLPDFIAYYYFRTCMLVVRLRLGRLLLLFCILGSALTCMAYGFLTTSTSVGGFPATA